MSNVILTGRDDHDARGRLALAMAADPLAQSETVDNLVDRDRRYKRITALVWIGLGDIEGLGFEPMSGNCNLAHADRSCQRTLQHSAHAIRPPIPSVAGGDALDGGSAACRWALCIGWRPMWVVVAIWSWVCHYLHPVHHWAVPVLIFLMFYLFFVAMMTADQVDSHESSIIFLGQIVVLNMIPHVEWMLAGLLLLYPLGCSRWLNSRFICR
jgi:hypothetical protein